MSIDKQLIKKGDCLLSKVNYDLKTSYSAYDFLKTMFLKKKKDIEKLNKVLYY